MKEFVKEKYKNYLLFCLMLMCGVTAFFYGVRSFISIMATESFWPGFGYALIACPFAAVCAMFIDYLDRC